jgi:hypothetical protein
MEFYLVWYDDDRKKSALEKIEEAKTAYQERFRKQPNIVLINAHENVEGEANIRLRHLPFIQPSNFYVGYEDAA